MGSSIYQIAVQKPEPRPDQPGCEIEAMTQALYHARELAMNRLEEEAHQLGADGIVGVRLSVNWGQDPQRVEWQRFRIWRDWSRRAGFMSTPPRSPNLADNPSGWLPDWRQRAHQQWDTYCRALGWHSVPPPPWWRPIARAVYDIGQNIAEFIAIGTAVRSRDGQSLKNPAGKPFQSDLNGQDFWTLIRAGYRPVGFVMGNCVYYVPPQLLTTRLNQSTELHAYTHALYDARELAMERLQSEAETLGATGVVGVTVDERQHSWRTVFHDVGNAALYTGEVIELLVMGTAVVPWAGGELGRPQLVMTANARTSSFSGGHG
jgi:uncharacterized protein YbjQ (UPF0145 family)